MNGLDQRNDKGNTAMHYAAQCGQVYIIEQLLKHGARTDIFNKQGMNVLHMACHYGRLQCLEYLINVAGMDVNVLTKTPLRNSCLHLACFAGRWKTIEYLLDETDANVR